MKIRKLMILALTAYAFSHAPLALAEEQPQGAIYLAQATGENPASGDNRPATLGDIRWVHAELRADIRAINEAIGVLNDRLFYSLMAVVGGILGILGVLLSPLLSRRESPPGRAAAPPSSAQAKAH